MITTFILSALALVTVTVLYFKAKGKKSSEKSSGQKISEVIVSKFKNVGKDVADGMRDLEWLKTEALSRLDSAKQTLERDYREYLTGLITSREALKKLVATTQVNINGLIEKSKKYKDRYETTQNASDKEYAQKYISHILSLQKNVDSIKTKLATVISKINDAEPMYEYQVSLIEIKRVEILDMVCVPDVNTAAKLADVNSILAEFKEKLTLKNIDAEVSNMMNMTTNTPNPDVSVTTAEIDSYYESL